MKTGEFSLLARVLCVGFVWQGLSSFSHAQSNIVFNGSFEQTSAGWTWNGELGVHPNQGAADGLIYIFVMTYIYQDLDTIPGRDYVISFATGRDAGHPPVTWGGAPVGPFTNFASRGVAWDYRYCYAQAQSHVTRLQFNAYGKLDDVKVGWLQEPIRLLSQPQSRAGMEGANASFSVSADGAPPLQYQWRFNDVPIPGATASTLALIQLRPSQAGLYSVIVSNVGGSVVSDAAELRVDAPPTSPVIVAQPVGDTCPVGYGCVLRVVAVGDPPLEYQWSREGNVLVGATNASLVFDAIQPTNAGSYQVMVTNLRGSVLSLPAVLTVTNATGGGWISFDTMTNNAAIYDVDGTTRLGPDFLAQVYAGATADILRPIGPAFSFPTGTYAGYIKYVNREIPDVAPGQTAYVQVRAWEAAWGSSYEAARANGGKFGCSAICPTRTISSFGTRVQMPSFSLRAGEPFFITGRLSVGERLPDDTLQFILTGEPGARYLIETRQPPNNWVPLLILTNTAGTSTFTDATQDGRSVQFYRARILD